MCEVPQQWEAPSQTFNATHIRLSKINRLETDCIQSINMSVINEPVNNTDVANKLYVDNRIIQYLWKDPVVVSTTGNQTLFGVPPTIDTYAVQAGDRVLVQFQNNEVENGIYNISASTWTRTSDVPLGSSASGVSVWVLEGSAYIHTAFVCDNLIGNDIVGVDPLSFVQFSSGGIVNAGTALSLSGNTMNVNVDNSTIKVNTSNQLCASTDFRVNNVYVNGYYKILNYTEIFSLPHTLTPSEFLSGYIVVSANHSGNLIMPSASSITSAIGTYYTNVSVEMYVLKNGSSHMDIVLDGGTTNPFGVNLTISADHASCFIFVFPTSSTGIILPVGSDHGI